MNLLKREFLVMIIISVVFVPLGCIHYVSYRDGAEDFRGGGGGGFSNF